MRLCIDMHSANTAIRRARHPMSTINELIYDLNGLQYVSKLYLPSAYHQLSLGTAHLKSGRGTDDLGEGHKISNIVFGGF